MAIAAVDEDKDEDEDEEDDDETNRSHIGVVVEGFDVKEVDGSLALAVVVVSSPFSSFSIAGGTGGVALLMDWDRVVLLGGAVVESSIAADGVGALPVDGAAVAPARAAALVVLFAGVLVGAAILGDSSFCFSFVTTLDSIISVVLGTGAQERRGLRRRVGGGGGGVGGEDDDDPSMRSISLSLAHRTMERKTFRPPTPIAVARNI